MKAIGYLLIILAVGAFATAAVVVAREYPDIRAYQEKIDDYRQREKEKNAEIQRISLLHRGLTESIPTLPDSVRRAQIGVVYEKMKAYNKKIGALERGEAEMDRLARKNARKRDVIVARLWKVGGGFGVAGLLLLAGGIFVRRSGSKP